MRGRCESVIGQLGIELIAALAITNDLPVPSGTCAETGFPRLYAAASLKPHHLHVFDLRLREGFPRLYAAASLKHIRTHLQFKPSIGVFRGFMPRPH